MSSVPMSQPPALPGTTAASTRRWVAALVALLVLAGGFSILLLADPRKPGGYFPPCYFHKMTGLHCPGCGLTRALHRLAHGDFVGAFGYNALAMFCLPYLAYKGFRRWQSIGRPVRPVPVTYGRLQRNARWTMAFAVLVILFGIARNLPFKPFSYLAPGAGLEQ